MDPVPADLLYARLIDSLYTEAMLLADEARSYFEDGARADRASLDPLSRVSFSCESLKVTTRLMHIIAWLLTRRAGSGMDDGQTAPRALSASRALGAAAASDATLVARLPDAARTLIAASSDLYERIKRLESGAPSDAGPARALMSRLERSL